MAKETEILEIRLQIDQFKKESAQAEGVLKKLRDRQKELRKENAQGSEEYRKNAESIRAVSGRLREVNRVIDLNKKAQESNRGSIERLRSQLSLMTIQWKKLSQAERDNTEAGRRLKDQMKKVSDELKRQEKAIGDTRRNVGNYESALDGMSNKIGLATGAMKRLLLGGGGLLAFIGIAKSAGSITTDFSAAQSNLAAILGTTKDNMQALTESSLQYGSTTAFTATQVTELQTELAKLGFTQEEILASTGAILNLAAATGADLASAAKVTGSALRAFNLDAAESERVASVLAVSTTKTAASFADYETALSTVAPVANAFGFSIEETVALFGKLKDAGFDASSAATATRNIILNLSDANGKLAQSLGGSADTFPEVIEGLIKLRDGGINLGEALDLTDKRSVAAFATFLQGAEAAETLAGELVDVNDELQAMVDTQLDNAAGDITKLKSAWEGFILSIEEGKGPIATFVRGTVTTLTDALLELSNLDLIFTRSANLTESQVRRTYDVMQQLNTDQAKQFQKITASFDASAKQNALINQERIDAQEKLFKEEIMAIDFSRVEADKLWDEWLKRYQERQALEAKVEADRIAKKEENARKEAENEIKRQESVAAAEAKADEKEAKKEQKAQEAAQRKADAEIREAERKAEAIARVEDQLELAKADKDNQEIIRIQQKYDRIIQTITESASSEIEIERLKKEALFLQDQEIAEKKKELAQATADAQATASDKQARTDEQNQQATLNAARSTAASLKSLSEQGTRIYKALAITETLINTYASATAAFKAMAGIPGVGPALGATTAAAAVAAGLANVARISAVGRRGGIMKAKRGAYIGRQGDARFYEAGGNLHSAGGTLYRGDDGNVFEVERDEILTVLNRNSSAMLKRLSDLNQAGGGVSFHKRGGVPVFQDGGVAAIQASQTVQAQQNNLGDIREILDSMPPQFVSVVEFEAVQNRLRVIEAKAQAG